jgi:hypothetical protein
MEVVDGPTSYIGEDGEQHGHYCKPSSWKISATTPAIDNVRLQALLGAANIGIKGARLELFYRDRDGGGG